jgi:hypothetical protein
MKTHGGGDSYIHVFLTSALVGGEWSPSRPGRFIPREKAPGNHWIGGWVDPRTFKRSVKEENIRYYFRFVCLKYTKKRNLKRHITYYVAHFKSQNANITANKIDRLEHKAPPTL